MLLREVFGIAAPTAIGNAFEYLPVEFGLAIVGHLDEGRHALDVVSLARAWFNLTALAPSFGLLAGLRTLCPQAVGGERPELCALYIRRALLCVLVGALPALGLDAAQPRLLHRLEARGAQREALHLAHALRRLQPR